MNYPPSKLPHIGTTIFSVMSKMAADHNAINLSQGFPDFNGPKALLERVGYHVEQGANQYAPMTGVPRLREAIAEKVQRHYGREVSAEDEITVTSGGTEALFDALAAVVSPGDEVIIFDPAFDLRMLHSAETLAVQFVDCGDGPRLHFGGNACGIF